jgi:hypothetical protein
VTRVLGWKAFPTMKSLQTWSFKLLLPLYAALFLSTGAQAAEATPAPADQPRRAAIDPRMITIDFPGGTLSELLASLASPGNGTLNVVGEKADLGVDIPSFSIRNAEPAALASALNRVLGPKGLNLDQSQSGNHSNAVYVLAKWRSAQSGPTLFESFQLAPFLENQKVDDIVGAIRAAWELTPGNKPDALQLKFHPATTLLLASGDPRAVDVARKVISTLQRVPAEVIQKIVPKSGTPAADDKK